MSQVQLATTRSEPLLKVADLSVAFVKSSGVFGGHKSTVRAVDNVSLELFEGEFLALVGETGSGKTTVARCLLGLTTPTSGSIKYNGQEVPRLRGKALRDYRKDVQIVYQDPFESLINRQTVLGNISIPIRYILKVKNSQVIEEKVANLLKEVGLKPELMTRFPHQLSGGERQRVNIARALASNPKVLIADEPITMVDSAQRLNILSLLMNLKTKHKLTLMIITHDLASAVIVSDRVLVMYGGKLVESGPAREVTSKPFHPYVELILNSTPKLERSAKEAGLDDPSQLAPDVAVAGVSLKGCVFQPRCKYSTEVCSEKHPDLIERAPLRRVACYNALNQG
ncbi:MAG: oligopeptide/dipeptide ABC transporter ATP-binding protein [Nitrososphaerales archaeon]